MKNFTNTLKSAFIAVLLGMITQNATAQSGNALAFDGTNDSVKIPYNVLQSTIQSIQVSVNVNANTGNFQTILTSAGNFTGYTFYVASDGTWQLYVGNGTNWKVLQGPAMVPGKWTNLAGVYSAGVVTFYVDEVNVFSTSVALIGNTIFPMLLGAGEASNPNTYFGGQIDELRLWNKALSTSEITSTVQGALTGSEPNLIAYYNFNEGTANANNLDSLPSDPVNTLTDLTVNHLTGTLYNFALKGTTSNWVASTLSLLPINLLNFSGAKKDGSNLLQWSTASEQNSNSFEIQRSENGSDFSAIGKVAAAGNSNDVRNYQYTDNQLSSLVPTYYYRLRMIDIDGSFKYSPVIFIRNTVGGATTVYPNPARDQITINIADKGLINTQALLSDLNGKVLQRISLNQSSTQVNIGNLIKGMYILKFTDGNSVKIIKE